MDTTEDEYRSWRDPKKICHVDGYTVMNALPIRTSSLATEWDGFQDKFWNLGQVVIWAATKNGNFVDLASDNNGALLSDATESEQYGLSAAAAVIDQEKITDADIEGALETVHRLCRDGALIGETSGKAIPKDEWKSWVITLEDNIPRIRRRSGGLDNPAHDLRFSRQEVLKLIPLLASSEPDRAAFYELPEQPPPDRQRAVFIADKALRIIFDRKVPRHYSVKELARLASRQAKK